MGSGINFKGSFLHKTGASIKVKVSLLSFRDGDAQVIYAPALEVYGYGKTLDEAKSSFVVCLEEFITYTLNKKTLLSELKRLGWQITGSKQNIKYQAPLLADSLKINDKLAEVLNTTAVRTFHENIPMAVVY